MGFSSEPSGNVGGPFLTGTKEVEGRDDEEGGRGGQVAADDASVIALIGPLFDGWSVSLLSGFSSGCWSSHALRILVNIQATFSSTGKTLPPFVLIHMMALLLFLRLLDGFIVKGQR